MIPKGGGVVQCLVVVSASSSTTGHGPQGDAIRIETEGTTPVRPWDGGDALASGGPWRLDSSHSRAPGPLDASRRSGPPWRAASAA